MRAADGWPAPLRYAKGMAAPVGSPLPPPGGPRMPGAFRSCSQYADTIDNAWSGAERYRMLISDLPRRFHAASPELQALSLKEPPRLTGTKWDALLAAVAEHIAITHDHPVPDWCDDPERSLKIYWMPIPAFGKGFPGMAYRDTPGAFLRHGVIIGGRELGEREGERDYGALLER